MSWYSGQLAETSHAAFNRYLDVVNLLVSLFEQGILQTAHRNHDFGLPVAIGPECWINECFPAWFATCQFNPRYPFNRLPVRDNGNWIYVERVGFDTWRNSVTRAHHRDARATEEAAVVAQNDEVGKPSAATPPAENSNACESDDDSVKGCDTKTPRRGRAKTELDHRCDCRGCAATGDKT